MVGGVNKKRQMKLVKLLNPSAFPYGVTRVAILSNKVISSKKGRAALADSLHGLAICRSVYTQTNVVMAAKDAIRHALPVIQFSEINNKQTTTA